MIKIPKLTPRLKLVADMIAEDNSYSEKILADIGTDHAKLPIFLAATSSVMKAYASDLREGPLKKARENIEFYLEGGTESVIPVLGNGTENIPGDYNYLSITGMGGALISEILKNSEAKKGRVFVLSPMTAAEELRRYLYENGYIIFREELSKEENKIYTVIMAKKTDDSVKYEEIDLYFSKALIESGNVYLKNYINKYIARINRAILGREIAEREFPDTEKLRILKRKMISLGEMI